MDKLKKKKNNLGGERRRAGTGHRPREGVWCLASAASHPWAPSRLRHKSAKTEPSGGLVNSRPSERVPFISALEMLPSESYHSYVFLAPFSAIPKFSRGAGHKFWRSTPSLPLPPVILICTWYWDPFRRWGKPRALSLGRVPESGRSPWPWSLDSALLQLPGAWRLRARLTWLPVDKISGSKTNISCGSKACLFRWSTNNLKFSHFP